MKKLLLLGCVAALALTGCSQPAPAPNATTTEAEPTAPLDLSGEWEQTNSNDESSFHAATITADTITIDWVNTADSTRAVYWAGSFEAPTSPEDSYTWESANDTSVTETALLASGDPLKTFAYGDGVLRYELTALGVTMTVEMERSSQ